ncbi:putative polyketide synthase [Tieghemostelium lacteum]|uniref:Putative polyketide synthase n=1 Tax=Tieghemostelium lacteum TaxID=361077 RepID=A0A152A6V2_TIELA|nr:putative polyketide synthase [Tieghemostelium lacteum]|eukprot:KYR01953.1 putative polyketide synthase [Tieghemostelium lacteum]
MENPKIFSIGTKLAEFKSNTVDNVNVFLSAHPELSNDQIQYVREYADKLPVETRYTVLDYSVESSKDYMGTAKNTEEKNYIYLDNVSKLSHEACKVALKEWGGNVKDLTHVLFSSCSGLKVPDSSFDLIGLLGLNEDIERFSINYQSEHGALSCLRTAAQLSRLDSKNMILVVITDLPSLNVTFSPQASDQEKIQSFLGCSDGSAAMVVGQGPGGIYELLSYGNYVIPSTKELMTMYTSKYGFQYLQKSEPFKTSVSSNIVNFCRTILKNYEGLIQLPDDLWQYEYLLHPGSNGVLEENMKSLSLKPDHCRHTLEIQKTIGNLCAPTVFFIMDLARQSIFKSEFSFVISYGVGISLEGTLLRNLQFK